MIQCHHRHATKREHHTHKPDSSLSHCSKESHTVRIKRLFVPFPFRLILSIVIRESRIVVIFIGSIRRHYFYDSIPVSNASA